MPSWMTARLLSTFWVRTVGVEVRRSVSAESSGGEAAFLVQRFLYSLQPAVNVARSQRTLGARAPSCRCLMLRAAPLEPVGLLVGWDRGRRSLQWRGTTVPGLPTPPRLPTHPTHGPAAPQPGSHAWCAAELGMGRVKLPKPSQPR